MSRPMILFCVFVLTSLFYIPIAWAIDGQASWASILGATALCFGVSLMNAGGIMTLVILAPGKGRTATKSGNILRHVFALLVVIVINFLILFFGALLVDNFSIDSITTTIILAASFGLASFLLSLIFGVGKQSENNDQTQSASKPLTGYDAVIGELKQRHQNGR